MDISLMNIEYKIHTDENYLLECIYKSIDDDSYSVSTLTESIELNSNISNYIPLIESIDNLNEIKKDVKSAESEEEIIKTSNKIIDSIKKAFDWWYKEDPYKKHKTLHIVLKTIISLLMWFFILYSPNKLGLSSKLLKTKAGGVISKVSYNGKSRNLTRLFGKKAIASTIVSTGLGKIKGIIDKADYSIYSKVNSKDLDNNIKEYDIAIDKINELLSDEENEAVRPQLNSMKNSLESSLANLIDIKNKQNAKIKEKENKKLEKEIKKNKK